jgi:cbb3-type cytochrome oxidase cytochrome c subunit
MKRGEKAVLFLIVFLVGAGMVRSFLNVEKHDHDIPFYSTATPEVTRDAMDVYKKSGCKECHSLWTMKNILESVPAPMMDGIGSLRSEAWLFDYLSSANPQSIMPSRLKLEFRMPSYVSLSERDRHTLAAYLASLKVQDWYLEQTKKAEFEKLTGKEYKQ